MLDKYTFHVVFDVEVCLLVILFINCWVYAESCGYIIYEPVSKLVIFSVTQVKSIILWFAAPFLVFKFHIHITDDVMRDAKME